MAESLNIQIYVNMTSESHSRFWVDEKPVTWAEHDVNSRGDGEWCWIFEHPALTTCILPVQKVMPRSVVNVAIFGIY